MSRKSRKNNALDVQNRNDITVKKHKTAIYTRLSKEDERDRFDFSIETQVELISQYIHEKPYLQISGIFRDNGHTGTNYDRPSFIEMMEEVKKENIDCIVVKDLSRFGRSYIDVSNYIEQIFPFMGVRFISVNDEFDTFSSDMNDKMLAIQLKSIMHDYYAKNLGQNVKVERLH